MKENGYYDITWHRTQLNLDLKADSAHKMDSIE